MEARERIQRKLDNVTDRIVMLDNRMHDLLQNNIPAAKRTLELWHFRKTHRLTKKYTCSVRISKWESKLEHLYAEVSGLRRHVERLEDEAWLLHDDLKYIW